MTRQILVIGAFLLATAVNAQSEVPNTFQAGQPARAAEVNENFDSLDQRVQQLEVDTSAANGQVLTAIPLASEVRYLFAEYFRFRGSFPLDNVTAGAPLPSDIQNDFISSVAISGNLIVATFGNNADPSIHNDTLEFVPIIAGDNVYFTCNPTGGVAPFFNQDSCVFVDEPPEPLTAIRKQVASAIPLASEARWMVEDYYEHNGSWPVDNTAAGLTAPESIHNRFVESVTVAGNTITAVYGISAHAEIAGGTVFFTVVDNTGNREWVCSSPDIDDRYTGFSVLGSGCVLSDDPPPNPAVWIRKQIESGLLLAADIQEIVEQYRQANGSWPHSNAQAGAPAANTILNNYVISVSIVVDGVIDIVYAYDAHPHIYGMTVSLTPTDNVGSISWVCDSASIPNRYLPHQCR